MSMLVAEMSANDHRLIEEAIHRLERHESAPLRRDIVLKAMVDQVQRGRRDIFTLVRTGRRALQDA